jgi:hypothetical protein
MTDHHHAPDVQGRQIWLCRAKTRVLELSAILSPT